MEVDVRFEWMLGNVASLKHILTPRGTSHITFCGYLDGRFLYGLGTVIEKDHIMFLAEKVGLRITGCIIVSATTFKIMLVLSLLLRLVLNCYALSQIERLLRSLYNVFIQIELGIIQRKLGRL